MTTTQTLTRFLLENLVPDPHAPISPAYIDDCEVWDFEPELQDFWDLLHWTTQNQIVQELQPFFLDPHSDLNIFS